MVTAFTHFGPKSSQFQIQVSKVDDLTAILETGDLSSFVRESVVQESASGLCQRMDDVYHDFGDIAKIIIIHLDRFLRRAY
jgi:midasin